VTLEVINFVNATHHECGITSDLLFALPKKSHFVLEEHTPSRLGHHLILRWARVEWPVILMIIRQYLPSQTISLSPGHILSRFLFSFFIFFLYFFSTSQIPRSVESDLFFLVSRNHRFTVKPPCTLTRTVIEHCVTNL